MGVQDIARACVKGPAWQCSLESLREGPTAGRHSLSPKHSGRRDRFWARPLSAALIRYRFATADQDVTLAHDLALLPRYAWQTSLQSVRAHPPSGKRGSRCGFLLSSKGGLRLVSR